MRLNEKQGARPPGQSRWKLLRLALIVALLAILFDFNVIGGSQAKF
jgi:Flp pilus assembly protein protease CpaA